MLHLRDDPALAFRALFEGWDVEQLVKEMY